MIEFMRETPCGRVRGTTCQWPEVEAYKGIVYAHADRFCYPEQVTHWEGVYDATEYGHTCFQKRSFYDESKDPKKKLYYGEFRAGCTYTSSEDCLNLNVWTPEGATEEDNLPVIVYIHGGSYNGGSGFENTWTAQSGRPRVWLPSPSTTVWVPLASCAFRN